MAVVHELICREGDTALGFGDYTLDEKGKLSDWKFDGDLYKIKTFKEITKLEKNGMFAYESVPGTAVHDYIAAPGKVSFTVEGPEDADITLQVEEEKEYAVFINGNEAGSQKSNLGGKVTLSVELGTGKEVKVEVKEI
ncbi:MAG: endosialidase [Catonella sp.]|jgi:hypothetical protein|nr:endosialidase [Catonella sp.]MDY6355641.1 endosialidase [Catonella sp.]